MQRRASITAERLARNVEDVCRHYLSNGRRRGRYWSVGDVLNTPGRSLFVRLSGPTSGPGAAGRWTDAATGEHGDLLDLIASNQRLSLGSSLEEAERFLGLLPSQPRRFEQPPVPIGSLEAASRLWAMSEPIAGTLAERYLANRSITGGRSMSALRFHPRCYHVTGDCFGKQWRSARPALVAKVTDVAGRLVGIQRTWLDPKTASKASVDPPRKSMGKLIGHGVRFGEATGLLGVGEGVETVLSLLTALPELPVVAALSAGNLAALILPPGTRRLYVAVDDDRAGRWASDCLLQRTRAEGIDAASLVFPGGDANDALQRQGIEDFRASLRPQLCPEDVDRLLG